MSNHQLKHDPFSAWIVPLVVAGLLSACGGGDRETAGGAGAAGDAPAPPPPATESPPAGTAQDPGDTAAARGGDTSSQAPSGAAAAPPPAASGGGGGPDDPKLIALGDSIYHGRAGGGTCYACHGQNGEGSAVGANLNDGEWLHSDGSYDAIVKTIQTGVAQPKQAPAPMPPMGGSSLTPDQVKAVGAYVYSLSHKG